MAAWKTQVLLEISAFTDAVSKGKIFSKYFLTLKGKGVQAIEILI